MSLSNRVSMMRGNQIINEILIYAAVDNFGTFNGTLKTKRKKNFLSAKL